MIFDLAATLFTVLFFGLNLKHYDLIPSLTTFVNCVLWLRYGVLKFSLSMMIVNLVGVLCSLFGIYKLSTNASSKKNRLYFRNILLGLIVVLLYFKFQLYPVAVYYCGLSACVCTIIMFASPMAHVKNVIKTQNVKALNKQRLVLGFLVSLSWFLVGVDSRDMFIKLPNGIGMVLSLLQLGVYYKYSSGYRDYKELQR